MLSSIGQNNSVQQFSALNAFKTAQNPQKQEDINTPELSEGINTSSNVNLLDKIDVNELRKCAETVGEFNISDDDIKYGLLYGRSVIAEYLC